MMPQPNQLPEPLGTYKGFRLDGLFFPRLWLTHAVAYRVVASEGTGDAFCSQAHRPRPDAPPAIADARGPLRETAVADAKKRIDAGDHEHGGAYTAGP